MQAAIYDGSAHLRLVERDIPRPGPGEALLKVAACGICGTDLRILNSGHRRIPAGSERILGHELSGEVVEVGAGLAWPAPGMRVALAPNMGCGRCDLCLRGETQLCPDYISFGVGLDGGFAEYMRLPRESIQQGNVVEIPHGLDFEAAALAEPLSCAYRGMMACRPGLGDVILIVGAGPIGLMHLQVARSLGAGTVIVSSHSEQRGREATRLGADVVINPRRESLIESVLAATGGRGADIAIVAAPSAEAQAQCVELMNVHGRINFFGGIPPGEAQTPINANRVHYRELCITGTTGQTVRDYRAAMRLIAERRVDVASLVSHRYSLGEICEAVQSARAKIGLKVMVCPGG